MRMDWQVPDRAGGQTYRHPKERILGRVWRATKAVTSPREASAGGNRSPLAAAVHEWSVR
jgi:hypothetical protein